MRRTILGGLAVGAALLLAPVGVSSAGLGMAQAACQSGTCCREDGSTCVIGDIQRPDRYALLQGGPCPDPGE